MSVAQVLPDNCRDDVFLFVLVEIHAIPTGRWGVGTRSKRDCMGLSRKLFLGMGKTCVFWSIVGESSGSSNFENEI